MDKVPWVGNGWVQLTHAQLWVGYGYGCQAQCKTLVDTQFITFPQGSKGFIVSLTHKSTLFYLQMHGGGNAQNIICDHHHNIPQVNLFVLVGRLWNVSQK
jgi:hypothetical protein